jgi:hypothetical protein
VHGPHIMLADVVHAVAQQAKAGPLCPTYLQYTASKKPTHAIVVVIVYVPTEVPTVTLIPTPNAMYPAHHNQATRLQGPPCGCAAAAAGMWGVTPCLAALSCCLACCTACLACLAPLLAWCTSRHWCLCCSQWAAWHSVAQ